VPVAPHLALSTLCLLAGLHPGLADEACAPGVERFVGHIAAITAPTGSGRLTVTLRDIQPGSGGGETATDGASAVWVVDGVIVPARTQDQARGATATIAAALAGRQATFIATQKGTDRHGRRQGAVLLDDGDGLAERLLDAGAGLADVSAQPCADRFLRAETAAREERRGIWRQSRLWTDLNRATSGLPDFVLGRGRVASVGQAGRTTYINFGDNFRTDATVRLTSDMVSTMTAGGHPPGELAGKTIEVRGWATERDGLDMELGSPLALRLGRDAPDMDAE